MDPLEIVDASPSDRYELSVYAKGNWDWPIIVYRCADIELIIMKLREWERVRTQADNSAYLKNYLLVGSDLFTVGVING